jgi:hypothetical protein
MPTCPNCEQPMSPLQVVSMGGVTNKVISWRCDADGVEAGLAHPVQLAHLHVGDELEESGRRLRIAKLEIIGAELVVFRQVLKERGATSTNA